MMETRPREIGHLDRNNCGFQWIYAVPHMPHKVARDRDLVEGGRCTSQDDAGNDLLSDCVEKTCKFIGATHLGLDGRLSRVQSSIIVILERGDGLADKLRSRIG